MKQEEVDNIIDLYVNQKYSCRKIAKIYDTSHTRISKLLKDNNVFDSNRPINQKYSKKDIEVIGKLYRNCDIEEIHRLYPNLSNSVLYTLMFDNHIEYGNRWTNDDLNVLQQYYSVPDEEIYELIGHRHSVLSIRSKRQQLGLITRTVWSDTEITLLKQGYAESIDRACELLPHRSRTSICQHAIKYGLDIPQNKFNQWWSQEEDQYLKDNWMMQSDILLSQNLHRSFRSVKWRRELLGLYRQDKEEKHYKLLSKYLRRNTYAWKRQIIKQHNGQCILTGSTDIDVHHYVSVNIIVRDILQELRLDYCDDFKQFTDEQLNIILEKFKRRQNEIGGVCINKKLHTLFHKLYGFQNNKDQFDQFCLDYKAGVYNNLLKSA